MSSPTGFRRHLLPWDQAWLPQAATWLAGSWTGAGPLDLSRTIVVVPTRNSARRLREALAELAARRASAVFPPRTHTPDTLLGLGAEGEDVASRLEAGLAWAHVLREVDLEDVADVLPVPPARRDFSWAWRLAENMSRLQTQLAEAGWAVSDVARRVAADFPERSRWEQLGMLERRQREVLRRVGRRDPHEARREYVRQGVPPSGTDRVVMMALPDPVPLVVELLRAWANAIPVDVVGFGPAGEPALFDDAGRPVPEIWERRIIELSEMERRVHVALDPAATAARITAIVRQYPEPDGIVALGMADPDVVPRLEHELSRAGIAHYNPEGRPRRSERLHPLLAALARLGREGDFDAVSSVARCPDVLACLKDRGGDDFSPAKFLEELDDLRSDRLPADLGTALEISPKQSVVGRGLRVIKELQQAVATEDFPDGALAALRIIFGDRRFDLQQEADADLADEGAAWREVMREWAAARAHFPALEAENGWEVALRLFGDSRNSEEKRAGALELQGWLELLWEDAPHLIVAGLNDGLVPDAVVGDAFLPESLRLELGLRSNAARFARDAYLLQALEACRRREGRLDLFLSKVSAAGDPLRPSRLLLRCPDEVLPERVDFLFRPIPDEPPELPWTRAWKLAPRRVPPPGRVPVTGLRQWLACPFRFYLKQVLRMEPVDPTKGELDAFDFGTLCHAALEAMAREVALRDCADEGVLREFLLGRFDRVAQERYGEHPALPLVIQLESARQRLTKVAALQAKERADGWVLQRVEWPFSLPLHGIEVRGKIDRVDRNEHTGAWRVLDYKTSDTAVPPAKSHLRLAREADESLPEWRRVRREGREYVWTDLQLPAYVRALSADLGGATEVTCGYINLPKAASETAVALWPELEGDVLQAAGACMDGVVQRIHAGEFWPPAELRAEEDDFGELFHHGAAESIHWEDRP